MSAHQKIRLARSDIASSSVKRPVSNDFRILPNRKEWKYLFSTMQGKSPGLLAQSWLVFTVLLHPPSLSSSVSQNTSGNSRCCLCGNLLWYLFIPQNNYSKTLHHFLWVQIQSELYFLDRILAVCRSCRHSASPSTCIALQPDRFLIHRSSSHPIVSVSYLDI